MSVHHVGSVPAAEKAPRLLLINVHAIIGPPHPSDVVQDPGWCRWGWDLLASLSSF